MVNNAIALSLNSQFSILLHVTNFESSNLIGWPIIHDQSVSLLQTRFMTDNMTVQKDFSSELNTEIQSELYC